MKIKTIPGKIKIKSGEVIILIEPATVLYFTVHEGLTFMHKTDGNVMDIPVGLNEIEMNLESFFMIHPDFLINLDFLDNVTESGKGYVIVGKWHKLPIDMNKVKVLMDVLSGLAG
jgi:DNA-binding LytR/AlgR family response regulator